MVRTPWYSFLLPILAVVIPLLVGLYIYVAESIMRYQNNKRDQEYYNESVADIKNKFNSLSENAYFQITNTETYDQDDTNFLKLINKKGDLYTLQQIKLHFPKQSGEKYYFKATDLPNITITKGELQKAICEDYETFRKHIPYGINFFKTGKSIITKIEYFDKPVITANEDWFFFDVIRRQKFNHRYDYWSDGFKITFDLHNFGASCDLIEINNLGDKIKWDSLPIRFPKYEYLKGTELNGFTKSKAENLKLKSVFTFKDSLNNKHKYLVEASEYIYTIKKL